MNNLTDLDDTSNIMMTDRLIENFLSRHGQGMGINYFNGTFTIICMTDRIKGGARTLLGGGRTIPEAIQNAEHRINALMINHRLTPQQLAAQIQSDPDAALWHDSQPPNLAEREWTYSAYRAVLRKGGKLFAIVTPDGTNALSIADEVALLTALNGYVPDETRQRALKQAASAKRVHVDKIVDKQTRALLRKKVKATPAASKKKPKEAPLPSDFADAFVAIAKNRPTLGQRKEEARRLDRLRKRKAIYGG